MTGEKVGWEKKVRFRVDGSGEMSAKEVPENGKESRTERTVKVRQMTK